MLGGGGGGGLGDPPSFFSSDFRPSEIDSEAISANNFSAGSRRLFAVLLW